MFDEPRQVRFLASVMSAAEARVAVENGADIVDCKDPNAGALGALATDLVASIAASVTVPVSATLGDLPVGPERIAQAALEKARTGVAYIKVGIFPGGDARKAIAALGQLDLGDAQLVGLLLADRDPDFSLLEAMADAGFAGAMLDTADKVAGSLPDVMDIEEIAQFVAAAHSSGLFAGLAGALRLRHIPMLAALRPDIMGFRGALCRNDNRTAELDGVAVKAVSYALSAERKMARVDAAE
jgi:(5-formylfuran-3-yl)methyl phosphate synthase